MEKRDRLIYVLDTNICDYIIDAKLDDTTPYKHWVRRHFKAANISDRCAIPSIVVQEIRRGLYPDKKRPMSEKKKKAIEQFLKHIPVLEFDEKAACIAAEIEAHLKITGNPLPKDSHDVQIAATARRYKLTLISHDADLQRIPDLKLKDWAEIQITWEEYLHKAVRNLLMPLVGLGVFMILYFLVGGIFMSALSRATLTQWIALFTLSVFASLVLYACFRGFSRLLFGLALRVSKPVVP